MRRWRDLITAFRTRNVLLAALGRSNEQTFKAYFARRKKKARRTIHTR